MRSGRCGAFLDPAAVDPRVGGLWDIGPSASRVYRGIERM
jgi:hypothetical protein